MFEDSDPAATPLLWGAEIYLAPTKRLGPGQELSSP
jgi:hypothetical protein